MVRTNCCIIKHNILTQTLRIKIDIIKYAFWLCFVFRLVRLVELLLLSILELWSVSTYQKKKWIVSVQVDVITSSTSKVP